MRVFGEKKYFAFHTKNQYTHFSEKVRKNQIQISAVPAQHCWSAAIDTNASRRLANGNNSTGPRNRAPRLRFRLGLELGTWGLGQIMIMTTGKGARRVGGVMIQGGGVVQARNQQQINEFMQRLWNEDKVDVGSRSLWLVVVADSQMKLGDVCRVSGCIGSRSPDLPLVCVMCGSRVHRNIATYCTEVSVL